MELQKINPSYDSLIEELRDIITEKEFSARWDIIECYHLVGTRLMQEDNLPELVQHVAKDLGKSVRTIYYSVAFAKMYPNLEALPDGKNTSWSSIVRKHLPKVGDVEASINYAELEEQIRNNAEYLASNAKLIGKVYLLRLPIDRIVQID